MFRSEKPATIDPKCLLYVQQREFAATTPLDSELCNHVPRMFALNPVHQRQAGAMNSVCVCVSTESVTFIGSADATTCHLVLLRHTGKKRHGNNNLHLTI